MYYIMYLSGLCERRHWPEPRYEYVHDRKGWQCKVRVNNREYTSGTIHAKQHLAKEAAASRAYSICRDFSVNDGMYPGQRHGVPGIVQGLPVAIGSGRRNRKSSTDEFAEHYSSSTTYEDSLSAGSSPRSSGSELDSLSRPSSNSSSSIAYFACACQRSYIQSAHDRCAYCVQDAMTSQYY